ncbi:PREDICTED: TATA box-binding protein-associated factor RNA polymerase I subunit A-like [Priapulus caudatus]|uniref:TATA box-binding protein-associated factor RNA polymerase I subunit A-like n=1 Tax=Priapulus caudatus TaxID=37621 RepID=A0ABM1DVA6_PRICU|nr:PREDICTED: TATA box-binding protein-associated factor RNA polymerase I subunit A-like [Priapulus caudatus]
MAEDLRWRSSMLAIHVSDLAALKNLVSRLLDPHRHDDEADDYETIVPAAARAVTGRLLDTRMLNWSNQLLISLSEAMAAHRWSDAARLLAVLMRQTDLRSRAGTAAVWRAGIESLLRLRASEGALAMLMRHAQGALHEEAPEYALLYILHLLREGRINELHQAFGAVAAAPPPQESSGTARTRAVRRALTAYRGMTQYAEWLIDRQQLRTLAAAATTAAETETGGDYLYETQKMGHEESLRNHAEMAMVAFEKLLDEPGVCDAFVTKYVHLIDSSQQHLSVSSVDVLRRYRTRNPDNPNAHRYLYAAVAKRGATAAELLDILEGYAEVNPSDELMLDYVDLLGDDDAVKKMAVLFDMLDYAAWQHDRRPWQKLSDVLLSVGSEAEVEGALDLWIDRKSWWPTYHFTEFHANGDDLLLLVSKAVVAVILGESESKFLKKAYQQILADPDLESKFQLAVNARNRAWGKLYDKVSSSIIT